jgi:hypothetical protein
MYSLGNSKYGNFIDKKGRNEGYYTADVGFAGIYLYFGIMGLLLFILILFKVFVTSIHPNYLYTKYYIIFLFLGNFAGNTLLGNIPLFCVSLYLITLSKFSKKQ